MNAHRESAPDAEPRWQRYLRAFKTSFDEHRYFWIAFTVGVSIFVFVPHIYNVWAQRPPYGAGVLNWLGYFVCLFSLIAYFSLSPFAVLNQFPIRWLTRRMRRSINHWRNTPWRQVWQESKQASWTNYQKLAPILRWISGAAYQFVFSLAVVAELVSRFLPWLFTRPAAKGSKDRVLREPVGPILAAILFGLVVCIWLWGAVADSSRLYPLSGALCQNVAWFTALCCLWISVSSRRRNPVLSRFTLLQLRMLSWLLLTGLVGELLWIAAAVPWIGEVLSYRLYTIYAVSFTVTSIVLIAALIDRWHEETIWPMRLATLVIVPILFWIWGGAATVAPEDFTRDLNASQRADALKAMEGPAAPWDREMEWLKHLEKRLDAIREADGPVVLVAASGGGSRAAIFTALALETLARTPLDAKQPLLASSDKQRTWADQILLISSVSGGSLLTAHYVHQLNSAQVPLNRREVLRRSTLAELMASLRDQTRARIDSFLYDYSKYEEFRINHRELAEDQLPQLRIRLAGSYLKAKELHEKKAKPPDNLADPDADADDAAPADPWLEKADAWRTLLGLLNCLDFCRRFEQDPHLAAQLQEDPPLDLQRFAWVMRSERFDEMCTDFMAPILRAALTPTLDRGDALARFWTAHFGWQNSTNFHGYQSDTDVRNWSYERWHPAVLFNVSDAALGSRLAVGFPPLPAKFLATNQDDAGARPRSLADVNPQMQVSLARAVRMSSNFPWGFRVLGVDPTVNNDPPLRLVDGGVVDNTGIDTIYEVFRALARLSKPPPADGDQQRAEQSKRAHRILKNIRERGVVVFEIDSGAKPDRDTVAGPLAGITEPAQALTNAAYSNAEQVKSMYVREIQKTLMLRLEDLVDVSSLAAPYLQMLPKLQPSVIRIPFQCNHYKQDRPNDVMTAWTLGPFDKAEVVGRFMLELYLWDIRRTERDLTSLHQQSKAVRGAFALLSAHAAIEKQWPELEKILPDLARMAEKTKPDDNLLASAKRIIREMRAAFAQMDSLAKTHSIPEIDATVADRRKVINDAEKNIAKAENPNTTDDQKKSIAKDFAAIQKVAAASNRPLTPAAVHKILQPALKMQMKTGSLQQEINRSAIHDRLNSTIKK